VNFPTPNTTNTKPALSLTISATVARDPIAGPGGRILMGFKNIAVTAGFARGR
jgi:hypothetical protein